MNLGEMILDIIPRKTFCQKISATSWHKSDSRYESGYFYFLWCPFNTQLDELRGDRYPHIKPTTVKQFIVQEVCQTQS